MYHIWQRDIKNGSSMTPRWKINVDDKYCDVKLSIWLRATMFQVQAEDARGEGGGPVHSWRRGREQRHCQWKFGGGLLRQCQEATCHVPQGVQLQISTFNITIHRYIQYIYIFQIHFMVTLWIYNFPLLLCVIHNMFNELQARRTVRWCNVLPSQIKSFWKCSRILCKNILWKDRMIWLKGLKAETCCAVRRCRGGESINCKYPASALWPCCCVDWRIHFDRVPKFLHRPLRLWASLYKE